VLSADTVVSIDGRILEKPRDPDDARQMLHCLSGRVHSVLTGVVLTDSVRGTTIEELDETRVWFRKLESLEIEAYVAQEVVMDKAGAYAIQGPAASFIPRISGNYSNVVGLPLPIVFDLLRKADVIREE
jgi:septum formation protein